MDRQNVWPPLRYTGTGGGDQFFWDALGELAVGAAAQQLNVQWSDTDLEGVKLAHEVNAKWHPEVKSRAGYYIRAWSHAFLMKEFLERAVKNVGYGNLDGPAVKQAMETIKDFSPMGMGTYTWTPTDHQGLHAVKYYHWTKEGTMESHSDWMPGLELTDEQKDDEWWLK
jgi:branched-chain amino acid transport system substrate-binding protein